MANETTITVIGNLVADPELRFTPQGKAVANFTVASTPRSLDKQAGEWRDGQPLFLRCAVWDTYGENVAESLVKGQRVIVQGDLSVRQYETKDGNKGTSVELNVHEVGPALRYATAAVTPSRGGRSGQQSVNQGGGYGYSQQGYGNQQTGFGGAPF